LRAARLPVTVLCVLAAGAAALALAHDADADAGPVLTITFRDDGPPAVCSSRPDLATLTIGTATKITLVNATGGEITVDTGGSSAPVLADGQGVRVKLSQGHHSVRMVPACLITGDVEAAEVTVVPGNLVTVAPPGPTRPTGGSAPPTSGPPGVSSSSTEPGRAPGPGGAPPWSGASWLPPTGSGPPPDAPPGPNPAPAPLPGGYPPGSDRAGQPVLMGQPDPDVYDRPYQAQPPTDQKGGRLVAVVALICILGVTVGIIRAIRAQHSNPVIRRVT
jgi:hypothetical protein